MATNYVGTGTFLANATVTAFYGVVISNNRGVGLSSSTACDGFAQIDAEVPLAEMFGYSTTIRSSTQGKAEFSMEFSRYAPVPGNVSEELIKKYQDAKKNA